MKALILAAGEGTRMAPLTDRRPKPMLPIAGVPVVGHIINALKENGIEEIILLVGANRGRMEELLAQEGLYDSVELVEQRERLGTAHAVMQVEGKVDNTGFIVINGDVLANTETIARVVDASKGAAAVVSSAIRSDLEKYGVLKCEKEGENVYALKGIVEKPDKKTLRALRGGGNVARVNAGIYFFTSDIFDMIKKTPRSARGEYEITDTLNMMVDAGQPVKAVDFAGEWIDLCYPWDLLKANTMTMADMGTSLEGTIYDGVTITGTVVLEKDATLLPGTFIEGNVIIKSGAKVGPNCYIRGNTVIGRNCRVGNAVEIKNSIIMDNSNVPHHNYVGDSVIGSGCNLGSGTKIANLRLDNRNVRIPIKGQLIDTGLRKVGAFLGDNVKTGINASLLPGTLVGADSFIGPGAVVKGRISQNSKVF